MAQFYLAMAVFTVWTKELLKDTQPVHKKSRLAETAKLPQHRALCVLIYSASQESGLSEYSVL